MYSPGKWDNSNIKEMLDKLPKVQNIKILRENIHHMGCFGDRCLFWDPAGKRVIQDKILRMKRSDRGRNSAAGTLEVISTPKFSLEKVFAEKCRDIVKSKV